jgi:predicted kinase
VDSPDGPTYVVVSGPPGSGKSTLAGQLAPALGLPLFAKDTIKQALMDVLGAPDVDASRRLGTASVATLLAVAAANGRGVLESVWHRTYAIPDLRRLPGPIVEVFCSCGRDVVERRYRARATTRAAGHFDDQRRPDELWNDEVAVPVAGGWAVIQVDTNGPVDVPDLAQRVRTTALRHGM